MEAKLVEIAMRIRELREILEITPETGSASDQYLYRRISFLRKRTERFFFHLFVSMRQAVWRRHGRTGDR